MFIGNEFHNFGAAHENALSPHVFFLVIGTQSSD